MTFTSGTCKKAQRFFLRYVIAMEEKIKAIDLNVSFNVKTSQNTKIKKICRCNSPMKQQVLLIACDIALSMLLAIFPSSVHTQYPDWESWFRICMHTCNVKCRQSAFSSVFIHFKFKSFHIKNFKILNVVSFFPKI